MATIIAAAAILGFVALTHSPVPGGVNAPRTPYCISPANDCGERPTLPLSKLLDTGGDESQSE